MRRRGLALLGVALAGFLLVGATLTRVTSVQTLTVTSGLTLSSGQLLLPDGSASAPALSFASDPDTGVIAVAGGGNGRGRFVANGQSVLLWAHVGNPIVQIDGADGELWFVDTNGPKFARSGTNGALRIFAGTTPTIAGCGTGATITGNNSLGTVVIGTTPGTCIVTFNGTWTNTPKCWVNNRTTANLARATANSTTTFNITGTLTASDSMDYHCFSS